MTTTVPFINNLRFGVDPSIERASHNTESDYTHVHVPGEHGHTHEHLNHPGGSPAVWKWTS
jgi:urease accessory protein